MRIVRRHHHWHVRLELIRVRWHVGRRIGLELIRIRGHLSVVILRILVVVRWVRSVIVLGESSIVIIIWRETTVIIIIWRETSVIIIWRETAIVIIIWRESAAIIIHVGILTIVVGVLSLGRKLRVAHAGVLRIAHARVGIRIGSTVVVGRHLHLRSWLSIRIVAVVLRLWQWHLVSSESIVDVGVTMLMAATAAITAVPLHAHQQGPVSPGLFDLTGLQLDLIVIQQSLWNGKTKQKHWLHKNTSTM